MNELVLIKQYPFGAMACDVYRNPQRPDDLYITREQIGRALEYSNPQKAIDKIHERHKSRLDPLSVTVKLGATDGKKYDTILYSAKGIYEICRHSDQPKADAFYDFIYEILEGLRIGYFKLKAELDSPIWKDTRTLGKEVRRVETDAIKEFADYAVKQGSKNAQRYYTNFSRLADAAAGITDRNTATVIQLNTLLLIERVISTEIHSGIATGTPYKAIFQNCKDRLQRFAVVAGLKEGVSA